MDQLKIKRLRPDARIPARATQGSAGYDLCACLEEPAVIPARGRAVIPTGIAIDLGNRGLAGFVFARSGLAIKHGLAPSNCVGVIDSDYRGEVMVGITNHSDADYTIAPGERIAQLILLPVLLPEPVEADELDDTARGAGGFGSTGRH